VIKSKADYYFYLEADKLAYKRQDRKTLKLKLDEFLYPDLVWQFQKMLRKLEYYTNCRKDIFGKLYTYWLLFKFNNLSYKLGFFVRPNSVGPGFRIAHYPQLLVGETVRVGENCFIHQGVTIGRQPGTQPSPRIGNNVYIAAGVVIAGDIEIADGVVIGANAVVIKSVTEPNITVGGVPAKKISNKGSAGMVVDATNIIRRRMAEQAKNKK
jgi:serine O-acetyltransferase